jgi:hypothetical protein
VGRGKRVTVALVTSRGLPARRHAGRRARTRVFKRDVWFRQPSAEHRPSEMMFIGAELPCSASLLAEVAISRWR